MIFNIDKNVKKDSSIANGMKKIKRRFEPDSPSNYCGRDNQVAKEGVAVKGCPRQ